MKKQIFILSIVALMSADYAKSQCGTTIMGPTTTTQNKVLVFGPTNGCVLNGIIQDNGTNVGIGAAGSYKLDVSGDINTSTVFKVGGKTVVNAGSSSNVDYFGGDAGANIISLQGLNNSYHGYSAGWQNTTGDQNTCVGQWANGYNTSGSDNTVCGFEASYYSGTGSSNTIMGTYAGYGVYNVTPNNYSNNSFFGNKAGYLTTTGGSNLFCGDLAGYNNSSASGNSFLGHNAGNGNTTGAQNTALGLAAGYYNQTGSNNTCVGYGAGFGDATTFNNSNNAFLGYKAGYPITTGGSNAGLGFESEFKITSGTGNSAVGYGSLLNVTTSNYNTAIGINAGLTCNADSNVFVGAYADANVSTLTNCAAFGYGTTAAASDKFYFGNSAVIECRAKAWTATSDGRFKFNVKEEVKGLDFIKKLRPVTYQMDTKALDAFVNQNKPQQKDSLGNLINNLPQGDYSKSMSVIHSGFIAQEVEKATNESGYKCSIVSTPGSANDPYGLNYGEIVVPLVKAVQELSKKQDSLETVIATLKGAGQRTNGSGNNNSNSNTEQGNSTNIHELELANTAVLFQNSPNPFGDGTTIKYFVPDNANAQVVFYDEFGNQLKTYKVEEKGMGQLNIASENLANGMYSYSLVVNGKITDTKKMLRSK
ncbi:MAG: tail fiber domain-containing protein [Bacteroidetes bacterium]|nr:tail fiber domain-containing protein [Bacteroidota bacterium]